jgi:hypothetical protein
MPATRRAKRIEFGSYTTFVLSSGNSPCIDIYLIVFVDIGVERSISGEDHIHIFVFCIINFF